MQEIYLIPLLFFTPKLHHHCSRASRSHMSSLRIGTKHNPRTWNTIRIATTVHTISIGVIFSFWSALVLFEDSITNLLSTSKRSKRIRWIMKDNRSTWPRTFWEKHRTSCYNPHSTNFISSGTIQHTRKPASKRMPYHIDFIRIDTIIFRNFLQNSIKKLIISQI